MNQLKTINSEYINLSVQDGSNYAGRIIVKKGQKIFKNQILTLPETNSLNTPIHSPCDGIIEDIYLDDHLHLDNTKVNNIKIKVPNNIQENSLPEFNHHDKYNYEQLITKIRYSGIIGLGGAGFPSFKKILNQKINYLIINAAECEAPISADAALMNNINNIEKIINGILSLKKILNFKTNRNLKIIIAIEDNKPNAINNFKKILKKSDLVNIITIKVIPTAYPNGDAKYLIKILLNKEIPKNQHSTSHGVVCFNVATVYSMYEAIYENQPLIKRIVTISGSAVKNPDNYEIFIGTPIKDILKYLNIAEPNLDISMGGYFMGVPIKNLNAGILKTTNSLIIDFKKPNDITEECINCGFCVTECPQELLPQQLYKFSKTEKVNNLLINNVHHCIECGICDTVCPSNIDITKYIQYGKNLIKTHENQQDNANSLKSRYENFQARKQKLEQEKLDKVSKQSKIDKSELLKRTLAKAKDKGKDK